MIIKSFLLNSGSKEMDVDGTTPKIFSYTASATAILKKLKFGIIDTGACPSNKFGAITALSNGVLIQTVIGGSTTTIATLKDNGDLWTISEETDFGSSATLSILGTITPQGFLNTTNGFSGCIKFPESHKADRILLSTDDTVQAVVQDDIEGLDFFRMTIELGIE